MPEPAVSRWSLQQPASWANKVDAWDWQSLGGGGWAKSGVCPVCMGGITIRWIGETVLALIMPARLDLEHLVQAQECDGPIVHKAPASEDLFYAACNCGDDHPGRPERLKSGCGASGHINPPPLKAGRS